MFTKTIFALGAIALLIGASYGLGAFDAFNAGAAPAPCACCGEGCTCVDCPCDALGCACAEGGECFCTGDCSAACCSR